MARLREAKPAVRGVTAPLRGRADDQTRSEREAARHRQRDVEVDSRRWYKTQAWRDLRWATLVRARFACAMCGAVHAADTSQLVGDHIRPHRGDAALFWAPHNIQCLCRGCHDRHKQSAERNRAADFDDLLRGWEGGGQ
ncbi:HNH endonuclease signature motif containing protein [Paracoccus sp. p3-h83]|uniref:HNH endonuclease signature motif containing protein n=1 Tax=Paracoccus sp. p3-h83 TaxID=3342805 RepID=UPI0035BB8323